MKTVVGFIKHFLSLCNDPLYANSLYMMGSMLIVSASGFFFWTVCSRLYPATQIGLATAIISVLQFLMNVSIVGINYTFIRYLPNSKKRNEIISSGFLAITTVAIASAGIFLAFLPVFSPELLFVRQNIGIILLFLLFTIIVSIDFATESIFMALRVAKYTFIKNVVISLLKLVLPFLFVGLGALGIFLAWAITMSSAVIVSLYVLTKKYHLVFIPTFNKKIISKLVSFSFINYIVGLLGVTPSLIIPILIANTINPATAAYYYLPMMIANLLYVIPYATTQSLFTEGSYDETTFFHSVKKSFSFIAITMIPSILMLLLFGNIILLIFGKSYSTVGIHFLQILAIAGIPVSINYLGLTILNVRRQLKPLLVINIIGTCIILFLSYTLRVYGLTGIGWPG